MTSTKTPTPFGRRILYSLLMAFAMAAHVGATWSLAGFGIAGNMHGPKSESVGYATIVLGPLGAMAAFVLALAVGFFPFGERPWLRWAILATLFTFAGPALFLTTTR